MPKGLPPPDALRVIERVFKLAHALRAMEINPDSAGVAMLVSMTDAFALLDQLHSEWQMAVWTPVWHDQPVDIQQVRYDLSVLPTPGLKWGYLFGICLIVEEEEASSR